MGRRSRRLIKKKNRSQGRRRRKPIQGLQLSVPLILRWCDAYHRRTGEWPKIYSGRIKEAPPLSWSNIRDALYHGSYGLKGGSSLRLLLLKHRGVPYDRRFVRGRRLTIAQIREWARQHHQRTGMWPSPTHGVIPGSGGETWNGIELALRGGYRGLPKGTSLAKLLPKRSRSGRRLCRRPLTIREILEWARQHRQRTGQWPMITSGPIPGSRGETWQSVHSALRFGGRGLTTKGQTLGRLLARNLGVALRPRRTGPLTIRRILAWADEHYRRYGGWPTARSGTVLAEPKETWKSIHFALNRGGRGLPGGSSLARLLAKHRGKRHIHELSPLSQARVLAWADAYHRRTGDWPTPHAGPIPEAPDPGETWARVANAMFRSLRGLKRGQTLGRLLAKDRGVLRGILKPRLSESQIIAWAERYARRHGRFPRVSREPVEGSRVDTWKSINSALTKGHRGLPGGTTLGRLLTGWTAAWGRDVGQTRMLSHDEIILWARAYYRRHDEWPGPYSGKVDDAPGETWHGIDRALREGRRGLRRGSSLRRLLAAHHRPRRRRA